MPPYNIGWARCNSTYVLPFDDRKRLIPIPQCCTDSRPHDEVFSDTWFLSTALLDLFYGIFNSKQAQIEISALELRNQVTEDKQAH